MSDFYQDRDVRGRSAEFLLVAYFQARCLDAYINEAPEEDYAGRASHDIVIGGEPWDVKVDYISATTKRVFVERASLEHTQSTRFAYFLPTPYGFDIRVFTRSQLVGYYNAKNKIRRADGTYMETYMFAHGNAGDQANNDGVFVPMDIVKADGLAPWQIVRELTQHAA